MCVSLEEMADSLFSGIFVAFCSLHIRSVRRSTGHFLLLVFGSEMTFFTVRGMVNLVFIPWVSSLAML